MNTRSNSGLGLKNNKLLKTLTKQKAFLAIILMFFIMLFSKTNFYSSYNLLDLLKSASIYEIFAFGVTLTVICGGCDLSIGGTMSLAGIVAIMLMEFMPMWLAIICAILMGCLIGFINGFFIVYQKTEPFIITLGMGLLLKGVAQQLTDAHPISSKNAGFMLIGNGKVFGTIPNLVVIMLVVMALMYCLLRFTQFGRNCYAIGGDYDVAVYSGINAVKIKWMTYVICGGLASLGGILLASRLNSGSANHGDTTALLVNCGVVVGGTSFAGGVGGIVQSALGILVFSVLENALNMLGIDAYVQQVLKGIVIVGIIWLDCFGRKIKREAV